MPFHAVLLDNIRCIALYVGVISVPKANRLNMERGARGSAQMFACCSPAPVPVQASCESFTVGETPTTSLQKKVFLWPQLPLSQTFRKGLQKRCSAPPTRRHRAGAGAPARSLTHCWQERHPSLWLVGSEQKKAQRCLVTFHWRKVFKRCQKNVAIRNGLKFFFLYPLTYSMTRYQNHIRRPAGLHSKLVASVSMQHIKCFSHKYSFCYST